MLGNEIDNKLSFKQQINASLKTLNSKWTLLRPFIFCNLKASTTRKNLKAVIMLKVCYLAHIWDTKGKLCIYSVLKDMLRVPFLPGDQLHVFTHLWPLPLQYTHSKLTSIRQLRDSNCTDILLTNNESKITQTVKHDCCKSLQVRNIDLNTKFGLHNFKKLILKSTGSNRW